MFKKLIAGVVCISIAGVLVGCGGDDKRTININTDHSTYGDTGGLSLPIDTKGTKITVMTTSDFPERDKTVVIQELSSRTGIDVRLMEIPNQMIGEKLKVLISSKTLPDVVFTAMDPHDLNKLGVQGLFAPINKYVDQLPNFKRIFVDDKENSKIFKSWKASDGNLYLYPKFEISRDVNHGFMFRKDIFDKNGIKEWTNTEEFYQALKKLKEIYPDSIPYASKTQTVIFENWSSSWGLNGFKPYYNQEEKVWKLSTVDDKYKDMLDFMRKLYVEKLMDPEFLTATQANWTEKMTQGEKSFVTFDWIGRLDMFYEQAKATTPDYNLRYAYPVGPTGQVVKLKNIIPISAIVKNGNELLSLKLMDYLLSPSGAELMTLGVLGKTYEIDDNNKVKYLGFEEGKVLGINDLEEKHGLFLDGLYKRMDKRSIYFNYTEKEQEAQDKILKENRFAPEVLDLAFEEYEIKEMTDLQTKLQKAAEEFSSIYVMENSNADEAWNAWIARAKSLGSDRLEEIYNAAQSRFDQE